MRLEFSEPLPAGILEQYEAHKVTRLPEDYQNRDCYAWGGPVKTPTRPGGPESPCIYFAGRVYSAALVAWALHYQKPYPYAWALFHCGDMRCVNGMHVSPKVKNPVGRPRGSGALEDTVHFQERYDITLELLKFNKDTTALEVQMKLREADIGGKTSTILAILAKARASLGLRSRIPSRQKKDPVTK